MQHVTTMTVGGWKARPIKRTHAILISSCLAICHLTGFVPAPFSVQSRPDVFQSLSFVCYQGFLETITLESSLGFFLEWPLYTFAGEPLGKGGRCLGGVVGDPSGRRDSMGGARWESQIRGWAGGAY